MHLLDCLSTDQTNLLMLFITFKIYLLFTIYRLKGKYRFYVSNHHCSFDYPMQFFDHLLIDSTNLLIFLLLFYIFTLLIIR